MSVVLPISVLIDTWWNVNDFFTSEIENLLNVLIDTWWNVNFDVEDDEVQETEGFNRYMVECEYLQL